jgi:hypothetical protein
MTVAGAFNVTRGADIVIKQASRQWGFGDKVVHATRPEWGHGIVTSAEDAVHEGSRCQRLTVRFERAGVKTLLTALAELMPAVERLGAEPAEAAKAENAGAVGLGAGVEVIGVKAGAAAAAPAAVGGGASTSVANGLGPASGGGWLDKAAATSPDEVMARIPEPCTDPFKTLDQRLAATLLLYRFSDTGGSLIDWAAAQTGLKDPLSRFNRHELERFFKRFAHARDEHLKKLVLELKKKDPALLGRTLRGAVPSAQQALRRLDVLR